MTRLLAAFVGLSLVLFLVGWLLLRSPLYPPLLPPLPAYGVELNSRRSIERAKPGREVTLPSDGVLSILLRPAEPVIGQAVVSAFLLSESGTWEPWAVHFDQAESGAFIVVAPLSELPLHQGRNELSFNIGRLGATPTHHLSGVVHIIDEEH